MIEDEMHLVGADRAELEAQVATHPFLPGMSASHIRLLADCAMLSQFTAGQVIFHKGETANRFYLSEVMVRRLQAARGKLISGNRSGDRAIQ
jgi:CRP-like cAMP-binding protein